jgi:TolA-binding protein
LFGNGQYAAAGAQYAKAAYGYPSDTGQSVVVAEQRAAQNAVVAYDSALGADKNNRVLQDSLFLMVNQYVERYPHTEVAKRALIEEGRRASAVGRWDVMATSFREYAARYPTDAYAPTAAKLVGDALYKQGHYGGAQAQWDTAYVFASRTGHQALADSVKRIQAATASTFADSLVKSGQYQQAAQNVYVAYADANPSSEKAADALRDAIETYMLADSAARARGDDAASQEARTHAAELAKRLITQYPLYRYRIQYQTLYSDLLAETGKGAESIDALRRLIADNPDWHGRADAEIRLAVRLDSLGQKREAAAAYQQFATDYPRDKRAADALYNGALTYLEARDTTAAAQAYGQFARRYATDTRAGEARAFRVTLLKAAGDSAGVNADLAVLCASTPPASLKADCATRAGRTAFRAGVAEYQEYRPLKLVIASRTQMTAAGIKKASAHKLQLLSVLTNQFTVAIEAGDPEYLAAATYYIGLAQWQYGNFLKDVQLPAKLSDEERTAASQGAAGQAQGYYTQAQKTWQALVDKATQQNIANKWVDMARDGVHGQVPNDL